MEVCESTENSMLAKKVDELKEHIDKKFAAVHRNIHSGDKVANALEALVDVVVELVDSYMWKCPDCEEECVWNSDQAGDGGTPMCCECDVDMEPDRFALFDTQEWKNAEAIVLRIKRAKEAKNED